MSNDTSDESQQATQLPKPVYNENGLEIGRQDPIRTFITGGGAGFLGDIVEELIEGKPSSVRGDFLQRLRQGFSSNQVSLADVTDLRRTLSKWIEEQEGKSSEE